MSNHLKKIFQLLLGSTLLSACMVSSNERELMRTNGLLHLVTQTIISRSDSITYSMKCVECGFPRSVNTKCWNPQELCKNCKHKKRDKDEEQMKR